MYQYGAYMAIDLLLALACGLAAFFRGDGLL
jgi:hypothetical protein